MNTFDHITSIHRSLSGQITVEEQQQLGLWLQSDPSHKGIMREVTLLWKAAEAYQKEETVDTEGALARFKKARTLESVETKVPVSKPAKVKSLPLRRYFLRAAVAAGFLFGLFYISSEMGSTSSNGLAEINTTADQIEKTTLEDGSTIHVNESTVFGYPTQFESSTRSVNLKGEAFFDIAKDASRPFTIGTSQLDVKVLGTSFNIYAYPDNTIEEVTVATGKVSVYIKETKEEHLLKAGDHLSFNRKSGKVKITKDANQNAQAWRTGILTFDDTPFEIVCQTLEKHFDIDIVVKNKELLNCGVTVPSFKNASQENVLELLETVFSMDVEQKGSRSFEFTNGSCD